MVSSSLGPQVPPKCMEMTHSKSSTIKRIARLKRKLILLEHNLLVVFVLLYCRGQLESALSISQKGSNYSSSDKHAQFKTPHLQNVRRL